MTTKPTEKGKKLPHCTGCTDPDPLGATHSYETIEHGTEPTTDSRIKTPKRNNLTEKQAFKLIDEIRDELPMNKTREREKELRHILVKYGWPPEQLIEDLLSLLHHSAQEAVAETIEKIDKELDQCEYGVYIPTVEWEALKQSLTHEEDI